MGTVICHPSTDIAAQCSACLPKTPFGKKRGKIPSLDYFFSSFNSFRKVDFISKSFYRENRIENFFFLPFDFSPISIQEFGDFQSLTVSQMIAFIDSL